MGVAAITHVAITLLTPIPRVSLIAHVMMDLLASAMTVSTSMNVIMVPIHVPKMLNVRTMLVHTLANVCMIITVTDLNA